MRTEYLGDTEDVICPYCKHSVLIQEDLTPPDPCECVIYIGTNEGGFEDVTPERYKKRFKITLRTYKLFSKDSKR